MDIKLLFYGDSPNSSFISQCKSLVYSAHEYNFTKVFTEYQQSHMKIKSIRKVKFKSTILHNKKLRTTFSDSFQMKSLGVHTLKDLQKKSRARIFKIDIQYKYVLLCVLRSE